MRCILINLYISDVKFFNKKIKTSVGNFLRCYLINNILFPIQIIHNNDVSMTKMSLILLIFVINDTVTHTQTSKYNMYKSENPCHSSKTTEAEERLIYGASKIVSLSLVINIRRQNLADV